MQIQERINITRGIEKKTRSKGKSKTTKITKLLALIKGTIHQEEITIVSMCTEHQCTQFHKAKTTGYKHPHRPNTIIMHDFSTLLLP
jgi:hypothetical protein